ncbi:MAG: transporter, partial [Gammaproteobacteria bacterium]
MLSYRFMSMEMDGNRIGTNSVGAPLPEYMVTPLSMDMDMHMIGVMYAPSDKLTLMAMVPYTSISMGHLVNMNGSNFTTESSGIGDVKLAATYGLFAKPGADFLFNIAVNAPTGSIDERDNTTGTDDVHLPYPMQLGSGTWDFTPGLTYVQTYDSWSWGTQGLYTFRTGENDNGYTLGNQLIATAWAAKQLVKSTSLSFRLKALDWDNIDGSDNKLMLTPAMVPTADPNLRGGTRVDALIGINFVPPGFTSLRLAAEAGVPVYQKLDGPQLETDLVFTLGAQYTF